MSKPTRIDIPNHSERGHIRHNDKNGHLWSDTLVEVQTSNLQPFILFLFCFLSFPNTQAEILFPLHVVLQVFPMLPPSAAHFLFNNFVGIIMWHTDQPCTHSAKITQSVLTLTGMVGVTGQS